MSLLPEGSDTTVFISLVAGAAHKAARVCALTSGMVRPHASVVVKSCIGRKGEGEDEQVIARIDQPGHQVYKTRHIHNTYTAVWHLQRHITHTDSKVGQASPLLSSTSTSGLHVMRGLVLSTTVTLALHVPRFARASRATSTI